MGVTEQNLNTLEGWSSNDDRRRKKKTSKIRKADLTNNFERVFWLIYIQNEGQRKKTHI